MKSENFSKTVKQQAREVLQSKSKQLAQDLLSDYKFQSKENENGSKQTGN